MLGLQLFFNRLPDREDRIEVVEGEPCEGVHLPVLPVGEDPRLPQDEPERPDLLEGEPLPAVAQLLPDLLQGLLGVLLLLDLEDPSSPFLVTDIRHTVPASRYH